MPNRIIRDSCKTSPTLAALSAEAERLFWRLTTVADDFGRFEADRSIMLAQCFPLMIHDRRFRRIGVWFTELCTCGLVQTYASNGKQYGFFVTWEKYQSIRAKSSKHPAPTDANICSQTQANAPVIGIVNESRNRESETESKSVDSFSRFWDAYPRKVGKGAARLSWENKSPPIDAVLSAIAEQAKSPQWAKDGGKFIPHPATWLNQERWLDEVTDGGKQAVFSEVGERTRENIRRAFGGGNTE